MTAEVGTLIVADYVADDQHGGPTGLHEGVVPVSADLRGLRRRRVPHNDLQMIGLGGWGQ